MNIEKYKEQRDTRLVELITTGSIITLKRAHFDQDTGERLEDVIESLGVVSLREERKNAEANLKVALEESVKFANRVSQITEILKDAGLPDEG